MTNLSKFDETEFNNLFEAVKRFSSTNEKEGITRLAYSLEEENTYQYLIKIAQDYGLKITTDSIGNVFATLPGKNSELSSVATGSHVDSVPNGGAYDGMLGVIAGLYAILQHKPYTLNRDLSLIIFRGEESSRFGVSCLGSKILSGNADIKKWQSITDDNGISIPNAMESLGYSFENLAKCELDKNQIAAFIELHIEQGKVLESNNISIGIVEAIAAPTRYKVVVHGQADHSGATPMDLRHDALICASHAIIALESMASEEKEFHSVATVGKLNIHPNVMNVIPGTAELYVDIRGIYPESIQRIATQFIKTLTILEKTHHMKITTETISEETPVILNQAICQVLSDTCDKKSINYQKMVSGAGHDAMYMAKKYPTAMLFIPSKNGVSHHKNEYSNHKDMLLAAKILSESLATIANLTDEELLCQN